MMAWRKLSILLSLLTISLLASCSIEPPLLLAGRGGDVRIPLVVTALDVVWDAEADWRKGWYYGWDDIDEKTWGKIEYPEPTYFEVRRFYQGLTQSDSHSLVEEFTLYDTTFRRKCEFGFYDLHVWSNIDSEDHTQVLVIDESDHDNVIASTTKAAMYNRQAARATSLRNQPEIFYAGYERDFEVPSDGFGEGWTYDEEEGVWVKHLTMTLDPLVYIYLLQVLIHNNNGRITALADDAVFTGMAAAVNVNTGHTSVSETDVAFGMRKKENLPIYDGKRADIIGGMFTTFGLCDMTSWRLSRATPHYAGSRTDLSNCVLLPLRFNNNTERTYAYDVTDQMRKQVHGGVITIEIDADTIRYQTPGSGFVPSVENYGDSIVHEFGI